MKVSSFILIGFFGLILPIATASAEDVTWIGGVSAKASDKRNWSPEKVPLGSSDNLIFDGTSGNATIDIGLVVGNLELRNDYKGKITIPATLTAEDVSLFGGTLDIGGPSNNLGVRGNLNIDGGKLLAHKGMILFSGAKNGEITSSSPTLPTINMLGIVKDGGAPVTLFKNMTVTGQLSVGAGGVVVPDPSNPPKVFTTGHVNISGPFEPELIAMAGNKGANLSIGANVLKNNITVRPDGDGRVTLKLPIKADAPDQVFKLEGAIDLNGNNVTLTGEGSQILLQGSIQFKGCEELKAKKLTVVKRTSLRGGKDNERIFVDDAAEVEKFMQRKCGTKPPVCSLFSKQVKGSTLYALSWNTRDAQKAKLTRTANGKAEILSSEDAGLLEVTGGATYSLEGEGQVGSCKKELALEAIKPPETKPEPKPAPKQESTPKQESKNPLFCLISAQPGTEEGEGKDQYLVTWVTTAKGAKITDNKGGIVSKDRSGQMKVIVKEKTFLTLTGEDGNAGCTDKTTDLVPRPKQVSSPQAPVPPPPPPQKQAELPVAKGPVPEPIVTVSARILPLPKNVMAGKTILLTGEGKGNGEISYLWEVTRGSADLQNARRSETQATLPIKGESYELEIRLTVTGRNGGASDKATLNVIQPIVKVVEERVIGFEDRLGGRIIAATEIDQRGKRSEALSLKRGGLRFRGLTPGLKFAFSRKGYFAGISDAGSLLISHQPTEDGLFDLAADRATKFRELPARDDEPFLSVISGELSGDKLVSRTKKQLLVIEPETKEVMATLSGLPLGKEAQLGGFTANGRSTHLFLAPSAASPNLSLSTAGSAALTVNLQTGNYPILGLNYQQGNQGASQVTPQIAVQIDGTRSMTLADVTGDRQPDLLVATDNALYVFYGGFNFQNAQVNNENILILTANDANVILNGIPPTSGFGQNMTVITNIQNNSQVVITAPNDNNGAGAVYFIPTNSLAGGGTSSSSSTTVIPIASAAGVIKVVGEAGSGLGKGGIVIDGSGKEPMILTTTSRGVVEVSLPPPPPPALSTPPDPSPQSLELIAHGGGGCSLIPWPRHATRSSPLDKHPSP